MYYSKTESSFDAAHFLAGYQGKCRNIHGHRWRVVVEIFGEILKCDKQMREMSVDFGDLKRDVKVLTEEFAHTLIYEARSLKEKTVLALKEEFRLVEVAFRPTAENFSHYFLKKCRKKGILFIELRFMKRQIIVQFMNRICARKKLMIG